MEKTLFQQKERSAWLMLIDQIQNPLIYIILITAIISILAGQKEDFIIIIAVLMGFIQEYKTPQTYKVLRTMMKMNADRTVEFVETLGDRSRSPHA